MKMLAFILILNLFALAAEACPVINGTYARGDQNLKVMFALTTREENGVNVYGFGSGWENIPADGEVHAVPFGQKTGRASVACSGNSLVLTTAADDMETTVISFTEAADGALDVAASGDYGKIINGRFRKE